jgi:hypothetical protein
MHPLAAAAAAAATGPAGSTCCDLQPLVRQSGDGEFVGSCRSGDGGIELKDFLELPTRRGEVHG